MRFTAANRGIATVDDGDSGGICGGSSDIVEETIGDHRVFVRKIEEVVNGEMFARFLFGMPFVRRELAGSGTEAPTDEELRHFHLTKT